MLDLLTAAASGLALGLVALVIAFAIMKLRHRRRDDPFMSSRDHWGM